MWKPINTAPTVGEFLVRGGERESKISAPEPLDGVAHIHARNGTYIVLNTVYYGVWINSPTEWHELP